MAEHRVNPEGPGRGPEGRQASLDLNKPQCSYLVHLTISLRNSFAFSSKLMIKMSILQRR